MYNDSAPIRQALEATRADESAKASVKIEALELEAGVRVAEAEEAADVQLKAERARHRGAVFYISPESKSGLKIPISKSPSKLATPVEIPAKPQLSSTGFASFDRVSQVANFSTGIARKPLYIATFRMLLLQLLLVACLYLGIFRKIYSCSRGGSRGGGRGAAQGRESTAQGCDALF